MTQLAIFKDGDREISLLEDAEHDTVWATIRQISEIFECTTQNAEYHVKQIFETKELEINSTTKNFLVVGSTGQKYQTKHYNLDMIIAIGYRVNSKKATQFRQWATNVIKEFVMKGFVIDDKRASPAELAKRLRKMRNEEKSIYAVIRSVFKESASDYEVAPDTQKQKFFALVQDKFLYAVTSKTSAQIIKERADHKKPNMGLTNFTGTKLLTQDIVIGKNYLYEKELEELEILCENFLGFCHLKAFRSQVMTFDELTYKLNAFLEFNGYNPFDGYTQAPFRKEADQYAKKEFALFKKLIKKRRGEMNE